jgi:asparagine synthase (glutamine-hydrolysing)
MLRAQARPLRQPRKMVTVTGFTITFEEGRLQLRLPCRRTLPGADLVTVARRANIGAVFMGRLYYRGELVAKLGSDSSCDAELALTAYSQWGARCIEALEGDYCLVIWDTEKQHLIAARDPTGGFPLFWTRHGGRFALSTAIEPLLGLLPARQFNMQYIAEYLSRPALAINEMPTEECAYERIRRVIPGTSLHLNIASDSSCQRTYWNWLERIVDPGPVFMEELADRFGELMRQAVKERIRGSTGAHFSGGMDSTSVALLARDCLCSGTGAPPLHAFSIVDEGHLAEIPYLESALDGQHAIVAHRIRGDDLTAYKDLADAPVLDEPNPGIIDFAKHRTNLDLAERFGIETLLTGFGGDYLFEYSKYEIAELLRTGRIGAAWRKARQWALADNTDSWRIFYDFGLANLLPVALLGGWRSCLRRGRLRWQQMGQGSVPPWILPGFARSFDLYGRGLRNLRWISHSCQPVSLSLALSSIQSHVGDWTRCFLAAPRGIMLAHPFTDPRLWSLALGARLRFHQQPGQQKPLLAYAMRNVLPDKIRNRRDKAYYDSSYYAGLARHRSKLEALVEQAPVEDLGIFDKPALIACLRRAAMGADNPAGSMRLDLTLTLMSWLTKHTQRRDSAEAPMKTIEILAVPSALR